MLYGKITSINSLAGTKGEITQDDTLEVYAFEDPELPSKGLGLNSAVTFDSMPDSKIPTAINIQAYTPSEIIITSPTNGPINIIDGTTVIIRTAKGIVTGDINVNSGKLVVGSNALVTGNVSTSDGTIVLRNGGVIKGNISINQGGALKVGGKTGGVKGNIHINQGGRVIMGDDGGGGVIEGTIVSDKARFTLRADSVIGIGTGSTGGSAGGSLTGTA